jgi:hypothetical protein
VYHYDRTGRQISAILEKRAYDEETFGPVAFDREQNIYVASGYLSDDGNCADAEDAEVREYAAGFGAARVLGSWSIDASNIEGPCTMEYLSADALGDMYVGEHNKSSFSQDAGRIVEYGPPGTDGERPILRTIPQGIQYVSSSASTMGPFAGDAHGNLLEVNGYLRDHPTGANGIVEYPKGSTTPRQLLGGIPVVAFALDREGDIFAEVATTPTSFSIEEFAPGASTPMRVIGGSATDLVGVPAGIAVAP